MQGGAIREIDLLEAETGIRRKLSQARLFQTDVVVVIEIVDAEHFVTTPAQAFAQRVADESGGTGDQ